MNNGRRILLRSSELQIPSIQLHKLNKISDVEKGSVFLLSILRSTIYSSKYFRLRYLSVFLLLTSNFLSIIVYHLVWRYAVNNDQHNSD